MGLLDTLFGRGRTKQVNRGLFSFPLNNAAPDMKGADFLDAYKGWVYACVNAIAEDIADLQLRLERKSGANWVSVENHLALGPLHDVNPFMTSSELWLNTQSFLELSGEAFWYLPKGQLVHKPIEIWPLDPTRVTVVKSNSAIVGGYVYKNEKRQDVPLRRDEVIHFKRFNPRNRYRGLGTVEAAALAIDTDTDTYSSQWNRNFFYNSAVPGATLETDKELSQEQYTRLKAAWEDKYRGVDNAHKTAIREGGLKFHQAALSQKDMEFLEQRRWSRDEILGIFRVPRTVLGITEDVNRANAEATDYVFAKRVIKPRLQFLIDRLNEFYLPLFGLNQRTVDWRFAIDDPVPDNQESDLNWKKTSLAALPWQTINEVAIRIMEGVEQGLGAEDIASNIEQFFTDQSRWRALRMARSEVITGYAEGSLAGYRQSGIVRTKSWLTAGDERVDPECALNEEQGPIPLDSPFASGHHAPIVHPNCRCVLQPVT